MCCRLPAICCSGCHGSCKLHTLRTTESVGGWMQGLLTETATCGQLSHVTATRKVDRPNPHATRSAHRTICAIPGPPAALHLGRATLLVFNTRVRTFLHRAILSARARPVRTPSVCCLASRFAPTPATHFAASRFARARSERACACARSAVTVQRDGGRRRS